MTAGAMEVNLEAGFELHDTTDIPLLGVVAAGEPYEATAVEETLSVPTVLWGGRRVFALRVRGNSMIDEGIHSGDYIIVEPRSTADNGQTVVAEIDGAVTVKKYCRDPDGRVRLQPANPEMLPLVVHGEHVRIIGVVAGVLRRFGFGQARRPAAAAVPAAPRPKRQSPARTDAGAMELAVNAIDTHLARWNAAMERAQRDRSVCRHVPEMAELGRQLQALRDWCTRTHKPGLKRALIVEANQVMRRMQRFATVTPVQLPELMLH